MVIDREISMNRYLEREIYGKRDFYRVMSRSLSLKSNP